MKLEDIGFYTLSDERAANASEKSDLWRCEILLTDKCNFNCIYCNNILFHNLVSLFCQVIEIQLL